MLSPIHTTPSTTKTSGDWPTVDGAVGGFVDVHSHAVPSGDDGAQSIEESLELCRLAVDAGTRVLFATPHAHAQWDRFPRTRERERVFAEAFPVVRNAVREWGLDLRGGWEAFPAVVHDRDPHDFVLEGTQAVLVEFPGSWLNRKDDTTLVLEAADSLLDAGLVPIVAHPERASGLRTDFDVARTLVDRGCLLCPNGNSALGDNGPQIEEIFWRLIDEGLVALMASDGHRKRRPPRLDEAYRLLADRYGQEAVGPLFDGSALPWTQEPTVGLVKGDALGR
jgi:protein-tyrosine phosphatase